MPASESGSGRSGSRTPEELRSQLGFLEEEVTDLRRRLADGPVHSRALEQRLAETQLKDQAGAASVVLTLTHAADLGRAVELIRSCSPELHVEEASRRITAQADGLADMTRIGNLVESSGIPVDDLGLKRPSLDDVFLHLTGHRAESTDDATDTAEPETAGVSA